MTTSSGTQHSTAAPELRDAVVDAMRRGPRRRIPGAPLLASAAVLAVIAAVAVAGLPAGEPDREVSIDPLAKPARGFAQQKALLGVLRTRTPADADPQVRAVVRDLRREGARPHDARLLGRAPSGGAYVLVPVREHRNPTAPGKYTVLTDALCLFRLGSQGGVGDCQSTGELVVGDIRGALAGQAYGLVPDGVASVRPHPGADPVPVRRNFYVYAVRGSSIPAPEWLDVSGKTVEHPPSQRGSVALPRRPRDAYPALTRGTVTAAQRRSLESLARRAGGFEPKDYGSVKLPGDRLALLVAGTNNVCLQHVEDGQPRGGGCGPFDRLRDGHEPLVGDSSGEERPRLVYGLLPDGSSQVRVRTPRGSRDVPLRAGVFLAEVADAPLLLEWTAPDGLRFVHDLGRG